jgi:hypothetical protein
VLFEARGSKRKGDVTMVAITIGTQWQRPKGAKLDPDFLSGLRVRIRRAFGYCKWEVLGKESKEGYMRITVIHDFSIVPPNAWVEFMVNKELTTLTLTRVGPAGVDYPLNQALYSNMVTYWDLELKEKVH